MFALNRSCSLGLLAYNNRQLQIIKTRGILENNEHVEMARSIATYLFSLGHAHKHVMIQKSNVGVYPSSVTASNMLS